MTSRIQLRTTHSGIHCHHDRAGTAPPNGGGKMHVVAVAELRQVTALEGRADPSCDPTTVAPDDNAEVAPRDVVRLDVPTAEIPPGVYARSVDMPASRSGWDLTGSALRRTRHTQ